jgi:glycine oxidase
VKVIVVGGGIIGCATAFELAKAGCAVTVFERDTPGAEASGAAAGFLSALADTHVTHYSHLALASWRLFPAVAAELHERTGIDVEYVTRGTIHPLVDAADVRRAEARSKFSTSRELGIEAWDPAELRAREPALSADVRGAMFVRGDHWINNERLTIAYAQAAVGAGAVIRAGRAVSRVIVQDGYARGVVADGEQLEADRVVLAAGAWTGELVASFGARLPLEPRRGQMVALAHVPPVLRHCIHFNDLYLVPRPSGELLIGATVERAGFQRAVTAAAIAELLGKATTLVPALGALPITRTWYGFRPWATDGLPVIGPWPGVENLVIATAHYRNGILLAPITARLMTAWILEGRPTLAIDEFLPDRFVKERVP